MSNEHFRQRWAVVRFHKKNLVTGTPLSNIPPSNGATKTAILQLLPPSFISRVIKERKNAILGRKFIQIDKKTRTQWPAFGRFHQKINLVTRTHTKIFREWGHVKAIKTSALASDSSPKLCRCKHSETKRIYSRRWIWSIWLVDPSSSGHVRFHSDSLVGRRSNFTSSFFLENFFFFCNLFNQPGRSGLTNPLKFPLSFSQIQILLAEWMKLFFLFLIKRWQRFLAVEMTLVPLNGIHQ